MALKAIGAGEAMALIRRPESSVEAYLAMVEENEIRSGISFYERARLASEAARLGLYPHAQAAIAALFSSASPAKRSKIGSFVRVHEALGPALRYPTAIPERLGLALAGVLDRKPEIGMRLISALEAEIPTDAAAERAIIENAISGALRGSGLQGTKRHKDGPSEIASGIRMEAQKGRVVLSGVGVTDSLKRDLKKWLSERGR
jgi:ParB family chromosome partitioning protein